MASQGAADNRTSSAAKPRRLGRGLASLMANTRDVPASSGPEANAEAVSIEAVGRYEPVGPRPTEASAPAPVATPTAAPVEIPVDAIQPNPYQPRRTFDEAALEELTASIRVQGILQPLLVVRDGEGYTLVAGERRLRAATRAELATVPCVVREATREQMLQWALIENIQRSDLNVIERAVAYRDYMDRFAATQQQVAEVLGAPRSTIANHLRLLDLCDDVRTLLADGSISFGHGKVLAALAGRPDAQVAVAKQIVANGLSVRQLEQLVARIVNGEEPAAAVADKPARQVNKSDYILDVERQLTHTIGTKVAIRQGRGKHKGRVIVDYYSLDDFDRIVEALGGKIDS